MAKKKQIDTIVERVKAILEANERSRNSDESLVANYWFIHDKEKLVVSAIGEPLLRLATYSTGLITAPSVIERARRLVQEECELMFDTCEAERALKLEAMKKYMPTDPKVIRMRRIQSKLWKEYINNRKIEGVISL